MEATRQLILRPLEFPELANVFYQRLATLNEHITTMVVPRLQRSYKGTWERQWAPKLRFVFEVIGATLEVMIPEYVGGPILFRVLSSLGSRALAQSTPFVGRVVVSGLASRRAHADLDWSRVFMKRQLSDAPSKWEEILALLRSEPGFKEYPNLPPITAPTIVEQPEKESI
jgi:hypothetical protein